MLRRTLTGLTALVVAALSAGDAGAQQATPTRYNEGPGVKISDALVFHPGMAVETRYDSNVFATDANREGAPYLRLIGHLDLATLPPQRLADGSGRVAHKTVKFRLMTAVSFREYFSSNDEIVRQRALETDAGLEFKLAPSRHFAFEIMDTFARQVTPQNVVVAPGQETASGTVARDINRLTAKLLLTPGGGRLSFALGYALTVDAFEQSGFAKANRLFNEILFNGKWRLLEKTAIFLDVSQQFTDFYNAETADATRYVGSKPLRIYAGFSTLFTPRLSFLAKVGYGNSFHEEGDDFSSVLAKTEVGYRFSQLSRLKAGYERLYADSVFGNFYTDHMAYAGFDQMVAGRIVLHLRADYRFRQYADTDAFVTANDIDVNLFTAGLALDWQIQDWVYVGVGYDLQLQSYNDAPNDPNSRIVGLLDYARHQVFGKVGVSY